MSLLILCPHCSLRANTAALLPTTRTENFIVAHIKLGDHTNQNKLSSNCLTSYILYNLQRQSYTAVVLVHTVYKSKGEKKALNTLLYPSIQNYCS